MKRHCLVKSGRKNRTWRWACLRESNNNKFHKKKFQLGLVYRILSFNLCKEIASAIVQPLPDSLQWPHGRSTLCMQEILTRQCKNRHSSKVIGNIIKYLEPCSRCWSIVYVYNVNVICMYSILNLHYHICIWVNDFIFTIWSLPQPQNSTNLVLLFVWRICRRDAWHCPIVRTRPVEDPPWSGCRIRCGRGW